MQLLDSEQLEYAFQLHGITLEAQARRFYGDIWQTIKSAEKAGDKKALSACERHLRHLCQSYFSLVKDWRLEQDDLYECAQSCSAARDNAREASGMLPLFEKQFFRYALCYMELNRALIRSRATIAQFIRDQNIDTYAADMDVNHGTGVLLDRAHRGAAALRAKREKLQRMKSLLVATDPLMEELGALLPDIMHADGDRQLTLFKGALRRCEFSRAQKLADAWRDDRLRATGSLLVAAMRQSAAELKMHEGILLHSGELSLPSSVLKADEAKTQEFLDRHNIPYMVFQYRNLLHLGYQLGHVGSLEGLIIHHGKIASLSVRPQADQDYAKTQQQAVLLPARALLEQRFSTLGAIFNDMETTQTLLEKLVSQTRHSMAGLSA